MSVETAPKLRLKQYLALARNPVNPSMIEKMAESHQMTFGFEAEVAVISQDPVKPEEALQKAMRLALRNAFNKDFYNNSMENTDYSKWLIAHDGSVSAESEFNSLTSNRGGWVITENPDEDEDQPPSFSVSGLEIISPIFPSFGEFRFALAAIFDMIRREDPYFVTNETTGLHVNIGFKDKRKARNIDYLKLLMFLGEQNILRAFNREDNDYTESMIKQLKNIPEGELYKDHFASNELQKTIQNLNTDLVKNARHYNSIDLKKIRNGYFEFRLMGGYRYEEDFESVMRSVMHYVFALHAAANPRFMRKEYLKKLYSLIEDKTSTTDSRDLEKAINDTNRLIDTYMTAVHRNYSTVMLEASLIKRLHYTYELRVETMSVASRKKWYVYTIQRLQVIFKHVLHNVTNNYNTLIATVIDDLAKMNKGEVIEALKTKTEFSWMLKAAWNQAVKSK